MVNFNRNAEEIKETDIVFDCPNCGKSLAIDYRGAGLTIPCTDCGQYVDVPIPEGMELTDIDSSNEQQEMRILNLRRSLGTAESRIVELERRLAETRDARANGERASLLAKLTELRRLLEAAVTVVAGLETELRPPAEPTPADAAEAVPGGESTSA